MFKDVPPRGWVYGFIDELQKAGVVEGYPDYGHPSFTRYEIAMVLARVVAKLEKEPRLEEKMTADLWLDLLRAVSEFTPELKDIGFRVERVKAPLQKLIERATGVRERPLTLEAISEKAIYAILTEARRT